MRLEKLTDIIPLLEQGMTLKEIGKMYKRKESTMWAYARKLRSAGFVLPTKKGRRKIPLS